MSLYSLILWNQVDILQKHFKKDHVHMRLWTRFYGMWSNTVNSRSSSSSRLTKAASMSSRRMMLCWGATFIRWLRRSSDKLRSLRFIMQILYCSSPASAMLCMNTSFGERKKKGEKSTWFFWRKRILFSKQNFCFRILFCISKARVMLCWLKF